MSTLVQIEAGRLGKCRTAYLADVALDLVVDLFVVLQILCRLERLAANVALELLVAVVLLQVLEQAVARHKRFIALRIVAFIAPLPLILVDNSMRIQVARRGETAATHIASIRLGNVTATTTRTTTTTAANSIIIVDHVIGCFRSVPPFTATAAASGLLALDSDLVISQAALHDAVIKRQRWQKQLLVMAPQVLIIVGLLAETGRAQFAVELDLGYAAQMQLLVVIELLGIVELYAADVAIVTATQTRLVGEHVEVQFPECLHYFRAVCALKWRNVVVHKVHLIVVQIVRNEFLAQPLAVKALHLLFGVIESQLGNAL